LDIVPDVAQAWEVLEDGWSYIFHLRDDVRWSDGVPVTAGDFECAWRWRLEPAAGRPNASALYDIRGAKAFHLGQVSDPAAVAIHVPDPATLIVELEEPAAHFLQVMSLIALPLPRHVVEAHRDAWTAPGNFVSNGPFRLESWQPGQSLVLTRNPEYHGQFRGNIDRAEWSPAAHPSVPYELYQAGDLDVCFLGSSKDIERLRQRHAEDYISSPAVTTHYLAFDVSQPPFHDPQVRRALALAIDKEKLADVVMGGSVTPALGGLIPPGLAGHSPGIALPYDPKGARRLLAQAGYAGGSGFPSIEPLLGGPAFERQGLYLQKKWHDVLGIEIALEILEPGRYVPRLESGPPNLYLGAWMADYPDPDTFLRVFPFRRRTGWRNEAYDRLVADAKGVMDRNERMKLYQQADRIMVEEVPIVPLLYEPWHLLVKPWVRKYPISSQNMWYWKDVILEPH
jgi:oligopeptide transport system substrate-binding protein